MTAAEHPPSWVADARTLRNWFWIYVLVLGIGLSVGVATAVGLDVFGLYDWITGAASLHVSLGLVVLLLALPPYVMSIVFAYRVQKELHATGRYGHDASDVVIGAIILNPYFLGWYIPASVLWAAWRARRRYDKGLQPTDETEVR